MLTSWQEPSIFCTALLFPGFGMFGQNTDLALDGDEGPDTVRWFIVVLRFLFTPELYLFSIGVPTIATVITTARTVMTFLKWKCPMQRKRANIRGKLLFYFFYHDWWKRVWADKTFMICLKKDCCTSDSCTSRGETGHLDLVHGVDFELLQFAAVKGRTHCYVCEEMTMCWKLKTTLELIRD